MPKLQLHNEHGFQTEYSMLILYNKQNSEITERMQVGNGKHIGVALASMAVEVH